MATFQAALLLLFNNRARAPAPRALLALLRLPSLTRSSH